VIVAAAESDDAEAPSRRRRDPNARTWARRFAVQALYQAQVNPASPTDLVAQFRADHDLSRADVEYFTEAVTTVLRRAEALDLEYAALLDRSLDELDPVERAILRLATWELKERLDVPWRVVIDQGVTLAHLYGASESHRYVNAVLDSLARRLRTAETAARRG
jgi:N utilization substance protein B